MVGGSGGRAGLEEKVLKMTIQVPFTNGRFYDSFQLRTCFHEILLLHCTTFHIIVNLLYLTEFNFTLCSLFS